MRSSHSRVAAFAATVALLTLGFGLAPASATTVAVGNDTALISATSNPAIDVIELGDNIVVTTEDELEVNYDLTLDLKGFNLTVINITVLPGITLTVIDSVTGGSNKLTAAAVPVLGSGIAGITVWGSLVVGSNSTNGAIIEATGSCGTSWCGAGIGGNQGGANGPITINSGEVTATGGGQGSADEGGAGIGGGYNPSSTGAVTINGGTVTANGGATSPGISSHWNGGVVTINGGTVTATSANYGAGIGGTQEGESGVIDINGGTITATGGTYAAGIGGGGGQFGGPGGIISIYGGVVTANPGATNGAGIGGGWGGVCVPFGTPPACSQSLNYGAVVWIGAGSQVTTPSIRAVGPANQSTTQVGLLTIYGALTIPSGGSLDIPAGALGKIGATGVVSGAGTVGGAGSIENNGAIQNQTVTTTTVTNHNYLVTFDGNGPAAVPASQTVRVYATSMVNGARLLPPGPVNPAGTFYQWITTTSGGTQFTATTALSADITAYAIYDQNYIVVSPATSNVTSGVAATFTVEGFDHNDVSLGDYTGLVTFTTSNPGDDVVTGNSIEFGPSGTTTVTATLTGDSSITDDATATVAHGSVTGAVLTLSSLSVAQGGSINYVVEARDAYGNTWPAGSIVTSDVSTDVITATTITFPSASPHVITANIPGFSTSATVNVIPFGLAVTGFVYDTALPIYALGTGLVGILLLLAARRRERTTA